MPFFAACGLQLIEALRVDSHGGSLRGVAQLAGGPRKPGASVAALIARERELKLRDAETFRAFGARIARVGSELTGLLGKLKREGKRIAGFGAPAKATTLLYHLGITPAAGRLHRRRQPAQAGPLYARHAHTGAARRRRSTTARWTTPCSSPGISPSRS